MPTIKSMFTAASKVAFNALYAIARKRERRDEAVFLSRQTDVASYDFAEIAREFERRGWQATMHLKKVSGKNIISYVGHVLREIRLLGRCKVAVLDRYDPVVSLLDFECEDAGDDAPGAINRTFPAKPVVMQLWHAFGAYKKFGFQSVGTPEGHSADFTSAFSIHRNYSWVVCSGTGARGAFAEAFSCPPRRVVALDRPEYDELMRIREQRKAACSPAAPATEAPRAEADPHTNAAQKPGQLRVLMAPTLRKSDESRHPFRELYEKRASFEQAIGCDIAWSFHPLEAGLPAPGNVSGKLVECDVLVTDYSSIVYEAYLLDIPTLFYIPDIEDYRISPGLNADPLRDSPDICACDEDALMDMIRHLRSDIGSYRFDAFEAFASSAFDIETPRIGSAAARFVDFALQAH